MPSEDERQGYVPNVVYSCGALLHGGSLVMPYGFSDPVLSPSGATRGSVLVARSTRPAGEAAQSAVCCLGRCGAGENDRRYLARA